jgi:nitrogen-specific signal transduction histidine kinase
MLMDSKILESELEELDKIIEEISKNLGLDQVINAEEIENMIDSLDIELNKNGKKKTIDYYASKIDINDRSLCLSIAKRMMRSDGDEHDLEWEAVNSLKQMWQL